MQGITVQNSPCWTIHPYFSNHLKFIDVKIKAPADSHNTDGLDPESCEDVLYLVHIFQLEMIVLLLNQAKSIWHRNTMFQQPI